MDVFEQVTVVKKANVYYDGKVTSRTVYMPDGSRKTLGIILPGEYEFGTADKEHMEVLAGTLHVHLPAAILGTVMGRVRLLKFHRTANSA